jgi:hypothetical protein
MTLALLWDYHGPCVLTTAMMMQDSGCWPWRHGAAAITARRMAAGGAWQPTKGGARALVILTALLPVRPSACTGGTGVMDWNVLRRCQYMRWAPALAMPRFSGADLRWIVIAGWMLTGSILLLVAASAMPSEEAEIVLDASRQGILQAHPEWPSDMRAAALAGIICVGMPADMVRVAWGHPTRTTGSPGPNQPETWYYAGRPSVVERIAGRPLLDAGSGEWTVSFINGQVVAWTD